MAEHEVTEYFYLIINWRGDVVEKISYFGVDVVNNLIASLSEA